MNDLLKKHNFQSFEEARDFCNTFLDMASFECSVDENPLIYQDAEEECVVAEEYTEEKKKKKKKKKKSSVEEQQQQDEKEVNYCIIDTSRYTKVKLKNGEFINRNGSYFGILLGKQSSPPGKYFFFKIIKETKSGLTVEELKQDENNPERFYLTGVKN